MARPQKVSDDDILSTARRLLIENPKVATTVIAKALGVSQAALFKRFGTKQELIFRALAPPAVPPFLPQLARGPLVDQPIDTQLKTLLLTLHGFFVRLLPRMMTLKACGLNPMAMLGKYEVAPPVLAVRAISSWLDKAVDQGQLRDHDTTAMAFILLGSIQSRTMLSHVLGDQLPPMDPDVYVAQLVDTVMFGVAPEVRR